MWKYKNTNEMFEQNKNQLCHSDVYLGKDFSDGLKHYKYLRKYKKNGHTYYIYDESELNAHEKMAEAAANYVNKTEYQDSRGYTVKHKIDKRGNGYTWKFGSSFSSPKEYTAKERAKEKAVNLSLEYIQKHNKQRMKDIPRRVHAKGIASISRMLKFFRGD